MVRRRRVAGGSAAPARAAPARLFWCLPPSRPGARQEPAISTREAPTVPADRPLVLVACTATSRPGPQGEVAQAGVNRAYLDALEGAGLGPVLVPAGQPPDGRLLALMDGLLLPGGVDVDPARYGQAPHPSTEVDVELDRLERQLLEPALAEGRPVLAICRGIQALNVALGGTLVQDLADLRPGPVDHRPDIGRRHLAHGLRVEPGSRLADAVGATDLRVNSLHHQGIGRLAPGLRATAWAEDGLIEGVEAPDQPFVVGVQCHPEELWRESAPLRRLFGAFGAAVRTARANRAARGAAAAGW